MVKRSIVFIQLAAILYLGALIGGQLNLSPDAARHINRDAPFWFMNPWHPSGTEGAARESLNQGAAQSMGESVPAAAEPAFAGEERNEAYLAENSRRYILSPAPALDAIISGLAGEDVEETGSVLIPGEKVQGAPEVRKKTKKPAPEKAPAPGPIRITSLSVTPTANGALLAGFTSAPVERVDLLTTSSPPRMVLELYGQFAKYGASVSVPPNKIFKSVTTELADGKMRIIGVMLTDKAFVAPVTRAVSRDEFTVEMTLSSSGQPNFELNKP